MVCGFSDIDRAVIGVFVKKTKTAFPSSSRTVFTGATFQLLFLRDHHFFKGNPFQGTSSASWPRVR
jgi:hypothetical protein